MRTWGQRGAEPQPRKALSPTTDVSSLPPQEPLLQLWSLLEQNEQGEYQAASNQMHSEKPGGRGRRWVAQPRIPVVASAAQGGEERRPEYRKDTEKAVAVTQRKA